MQLFIRGVGDIDPILTSDSPVGIYVDGIILGRAAGSAFDILDLERIEVLRGPQGTLYGRNTIGGAVNLITAKPADDFHAGLDASAGNYGYYSLKTSVDTGNIADSGLKARLTYLHKQRDGYVDDVNAPDNRDPGAYVLDAVRGAVSFRSGALKVDYGFDWSKRESYAPAFQLTVVRPDVLAYLQASSALGGDAPVVSPGRMDSIALNQGKMTDRVIGHTLTAELDLGGVTLRSLTDYDHYNKSAAAFAQGTYKLTDTLSVMGGIRYTHDKKHLVQRSPLVRELDASFQRVNYAFSINWQATPSMLVYARTASGYKAGGFNARSINSGFDPESLTSYEAGIKSDWLDRRLRMNLTGFYASHSDLQLQQFQAGTGCASSITVNAGKARYWGIEAELTAKPIDVVTLGANLGYTNRKYKQFLILDPTSNQIVDVKDSAHFLVGATTTIGAYAQWDVAETSIGRLSIRGDYDYRTKVYYHPTTVGTPYNDDIAGAPRHLVNGRISLMDIDLNGAKAELALWGKNIFDAKYRLFGIDFGSIGYAGNTYGEPATYGVDFRLKL